jgi:uncharacterized protein (DUF433 family)
VIAYSVGDKGWNVADLAYEFTLTESEVLAALLYYQEHKTEIDVQEAVEQAQKDEMYRRSKRSLLGAYADLGRAPTADEINEVRREAWKNFPREDFL